MDQYCSVCAQKKLLELSFQENKEIFQQIDKNVILDNDGLTCLECGIGIYAPYACIEPG